MPLSPESQHVINSLEAHLVAAKAAITALEGLLVKLGGTVPAAAQSQRATVGTLTGTLTTPAPGAEPTPNT
jgi:hypothetical protein